jgi:hypothetical protein
VTGLAKWRFAANWLGQLLADELQGRIAQRRRADLFTQRRRNQAARKNAPRNHHIQCEQEFRLAHSGSSYPNDTCLFC